MLDTVQPYETGNDALWGMDDLNIRDKHQLLIPNFHAMLFYDIRLKDKKTGELIDLPAILNDRSGDVPLRDYFDRDLDLQNKGHGSATIIFNVGVPFQGEAIVPTLHEIAEVVRGSSTLSTLKSSEIRIGS